MPLSPGRERVHQARADGENETGPYEVVEKWPAPWAQKGYIWGSQPGVFAETPNKIFIAARGELKLPETLGRGFNGAWGSLNQRATEPKPEMRNCIVIVDGSGKLDPKDYERTVTTLLTGGSDPVITKQPTGAWTHAVYDAMK